MRSPVITGLGIITPPGCDVNEVWNAMTAGQSGLGALTLFESNRYGQSPIAEIRQDLVALGAPLHGSRSDRLAWLAARAAIESARLKNFDGDRAGITLGCSVGGSLGSERFLTSLIKRGKMWTRPTRFHECATATDLVAESFGLYGPAVTLATACSSSALAIATAADMIVAGEADVMLAGGGDSVARMTWGGFHSLLLVDAVGCRPFDVARAGMSLGEGAADFADVLLDVMRGVIDRGTGAGIRSRYGIAADVAGKTGTTSDNTDAWFILMHSQLVAGAWVGFNDNRVTMQDSWGQGARAALPIVGETFQKAFAQKVIDAQLRFPAPNLAPPPPRAEPEIIQVPVGIPGTPIPAAGGTAMPEPAPLYGN